MFENVGAQLRRLRDEVKGEKPDWLVQIEQSNLTIDENARAIAEGQMLWERNAAERVHARRALQAQAEADRQAALEARAQGVADDLRAMRKMMEVQQLFSEYPVLSGNSFGQPLLGNAEYLADDNRFALVKPGNARKGF